MLAVEILFENRSDFDWEPLVRGFIKKDRRATKDLLDRLRPLMKGLAAGYKGDDPVADDWITDFVTKRLPKIAQMAAKNMSKGKYKAGQFPALVTASFRNFMNNKVRDAKLRAQREREAGTMRGVATDSPSASMAASDKSFIAKLVKKYIDQEKNPEARKFLLHLTGLSNSSTLTFGHLTGGEINQALNSAGLDPKKWQGSGRASKARAKLFDRLRNDRSFRKFAGVEDRSLYGPSLKEFVAAIQPSLVEDVDLEENFYRWLMGKLHG